MNGAAPGEGRYARTERERRFLLGAVPTDAGDGVRIDDLYLAGTRLRLRRVEGPDGVVVHKLGQKVRPVPADPSLVRHTTIYLDAAEHEVLRILPGHAIAKTRHRWDVGGRRFAVDEFAGDLAGLVLAEIELTDDAGDAPPGTVVEVTADDRFSGGALATAPAGFVDEVVARLLEDGR